MKKFTVLLLLVLSFVTAFAQQTQSVEMADVLRSSGKIYVVVVLVLGAPTGLYMSFFAKGSYWERILFAFMAIYWFYTTIKGLQSIKQKNVLSHKNWMMRSYSMAMTAVTFRIYHIAFYYFGLDHLNNYEISLWISVLGNMLVAEYFVFRKSRSYLKTFLA